VFEYKDGSKHNTADLEIRITPSSQLKGDKAVSIPGNGAILPIRLPGSTSTVN
jgi:hypothetical protein